MLASAFVSEGAVPAPVGPVGDTISGSAFSDRQLTHPRTASQLLYSLLACLLIDRSTHSLPGPSQHSRRSQACTQSRRKHQKDFFCSSLDRLRAAARLRTFERYGLCINRR